MDLDGRRVMLVGLGDIGLAVADRLAAAGARIFGSYHRSTQAAERLRGTIAADRLAGSAALDATDPEQVRKVLGPGGLAVRALGGVDTLVVTAGHKHELALLKDTDPTLIRQVLDTELLGPTLLVREILPQLLGTGFGRIVLIGSDSGKAGTLGDAASSAARAGVAGLARSVARETARADVTINVVSPGPTETALLHGMLDSPGLTGKVMAGTLKAVPKARPAQPAEIAAAVAYLVAPDAGFTTGQVLSVSGGLSM